MALSMNITNSTNNVQAKPAYGRIDFTNVSLGAPVMPITLNWYWDKASANLQLSPVRTDQLQITATQLSAANPAFVTSLQTLCSNGSIVSPIDAFVGAVYILVMQMADYSTALSV